MKNANPLSWLLVVLLAATPVLFSGCGETPRSAAPVPATTYFPIAVGGVVAQVQLAVEPAEMARGLMGRRDLGPEQGMLFVYQQPQAMSFWMRNTPTPLDIGFFDAQGVLREIYPMFPFDETSVKSRSRELMYALEMNQGWFSRQGLRPGAKLDLAALADALEARGFAREPR